MINIVQRKNKVKNSENCYGSVVGYNDIFGNSLDNVKFNYKNFAATINKQIIGENGEMVFYDINNKPYSIAIRDVYLMEYLILKSCEEDYIKQEYELNDILDDIDTVNSIDTNEIIK